MLTNQFLLPVHSELVVDLFAGGGGASITKTAQMRMCGNSVCPPLSHALVKANYCERQALRKAA